MPQILVIGSGVIGLSSALLAQDTGHAVTILSELWSYDEKHVGYTSSWAGAHHVSVATSLDMRQHRFDADTFKVMQDMLASDPDVPLMLRPQIEYREEPRVNGVDDQLDLLRAFMPDYQETDAADLPEGVSHGVSFSTMMIDSPNYLAYLLARFRKNGGKTIESGHLGSIDEAIQLFTTESQLSVDAVVNCTGLGSRELVGDDKVFPTRGQTVLVRAPWIKGGITRTGAKGAGIYTYIIPRRSGDVIVGGTADANDWEPTPRPETTKMILTRGLALCPELLPVDKREGGTIDDIDVIEAGCGRRPTRMGGIRIETEWIMSSEGIKLPLVHNYGHGGYGYQSSWGSAQMAIDLVGKALATV